jgi:hypothetical protein
MTALYGENVTRAHITQGDSTMKKILVLGALALSIGLLSEQPASAWVNCKFGVGLNWNWQSGGNNFLWGAFRNGQPPGPDCAYPRGGGYPGHGPTFPGFTPYGPYDFQYFGQQPQGNGNGAQNTNIPAPAQAPPGGANQTSSYYYPSVYQAVNYSPAYYGYNYPYNYTSGYYNPAQGYNYASGYYNPAQGYYGYQAPSYWYGR